MHRSLIISLAILASLYSFSQNNGANDISGKTVAEQSILQLKEGALLVRLPSKQDKILDLRKAGKTDMANAIEQAQLEENQKLASAFRKYFIFTKVYFFYADDTEKLQSGNTAGIFLDKKLQRDEDIILDSDFYLIAEYGPATTKPDRFEEQGKEPIQDFENNDLSSNLLKVTDARLKSIPKPFPGAIKANNINMADKQVSKLNKKLHEYYLRVTNG